MGRGSDYTVDPGMVFGLGTVLRADLRIPRTTPDGKPNGAKRACLLRCHDACGAEYVATWSDLRRGRCTSCGCKGSDQSEWEAKKALRAQARNRGFKIDVIKLSKIDQP
jgi:hypothetical protein